MGGDMALYLVAEAIRAFFKNRSLSPWALADNWPHTQRHLRILDVTGRTHGAWADARSGA